MKRSSSRQPATADILYAPPPERVVTTNAWAFLHWLAAAGAVRLADWDALQRWSVAAPAEFQAAVAAFAGLRAGQDSRAIRRTAALLLHLDLRPDDRVLIDAGASHALGDIAYGAATILHRQGAQALLQTASDAAASVILAHAATLSSATFRQPAGRHALATLRLVAAFGNALSPTVRTRIYTWVKADVMLLASAGDTVWGDPLSPVLRVPQPRPALGATLRPPPSANPDGR